MTYTIILTEEQMRVLIKHWGKNLEYGYEGSFGGHDTKNKQEVEEVNEEIKIGQKILEKLIKTRFN